MAGGPPPDPNAEAFLVHRDDAGRRLITELHPDRSPLIIGRGETSDVALPWDARVSRTHAEIERVGRDWAVVDDGLSRNGTWVNAERVTARRRLRDGDVVTVGDTSLTFRAPDGASSAALTVSADGRPMREALTPPQRRVLLALCRPYKDSTFATPASNPDIARELTLSVDAVKTTMRALFEVFGIDDLPQNQKRAALAQQALRSGAVTRRDL